MSEELWPTPPSWAWTTLDDVASWSSGGTPKSGEPSFYGGEIPWLIIGDLNDGLVTSSAKTITKLGLENSSSKYVEPGAVLIALYGSIGKLGIAGFRCTTNQAIAFTKSISEAVEQPFLFRYLQNVRPRLLEMGKGVGQPNISQTILKAFPICVAPQAEQRRIVAKLEKLLGQVDACRQRLEKMPKLLKRFRQSILAAACSGRLTADWREERDLDDEWPVEPLSEFFEMRNGKSLVATKRQEGEIPVFGGNGLMGTHNVANAEGLVIVIGRVGAQCGNVHYVTGKVWVTDNAISLQGKKELVPAFYAYFLRSLNLNTISAGTGQPYVSQEILGPIETPVVSLAEQQEIVRRVAGLFALADQLEQRLAQARKQVDKLTPSLLARAFAGQLVPQNPEDEPAEKLLERIKAKF